MCMAQDYNILSARPLGSVVWRLRLMAVLMAVLQWSRCLATPLNTAEHRVYIQNTAGLRAAHSNVRQGHRKMGKMHMIQRYNLSPARRLSNAAWRCTLPAVTLWYIRPTTSTLRRYIETPLLDHLATTTSGENSET
jgi:hypothetical protein